MRSAALAAAMICGTLGLALAFAPRRARWLCLIVLATNAVAFTGIGSPDSWREAIFLCSWISVVLAAGATYLPRGIDTRIAFALSLNAGAWTGAVIAVAGSPIDLAKALPCAAVAWPAVWLAEHRASIAVKVVSSWLIAIAALAAMLHVVPVTPGYLPDHLE